jgi:dipeptidyl aminopeptidase/acylaminoacyl peptidase
VRQAEELLVELKKNNIPFQKHIEKEEGHGFHHLDNEVALYTEIEAFLAKNLAATSAEVVATSVPKK